MEVENRPILNSQIIQFIKFGLVGLVNTVVSYIIYLVCYYVFHISINTAYFWGFVISVLVAYLLQNRFVFKEDEGGEKRVWWKVLIKTYISYIFTGLILSELLLTLWVNIIYMEQYLAGISVWLQRFNLNIGAHDLAVTVAPFLNMVITIPTNFCINKFWAYRQKKTDNACN